MRGLSLRLKADTVIVLPTQFEGRWSMGRFCSLNVETACAGRDGCSSVPWLSKMHRCRWTQDDEVQSVHTWHETARWHVLEAPQTCFSAVVANAPHRRRELGCLQCWPKMHGRFLAARSEG
mmetsp:Transcript_36536/g.94933  ORF Transcript_36536/g.94933 Transcript_36536/m.94933 type:complete len:121 (-) Transcript_36536:41-403(-)